MDTLGKPPSNLSPVTLGTVYVVQFTNGTVKVGKSADGLGRVMQHAATGKVHGNPMTTYWVSDAHETYSESEEALINFCASIASEQIANEWFIGVSFHEVVSRAMLLVTLSTDSELLAKEVSKAKQVLWAANLVPGTSSDVRRIFIEDKGSTIQSSKAYETYLERTVDSTPLRQKEFVKAMEHLGFERQRRERGNFFLNVKVS